MVATPQARQPLTTASAPVRHPPGAAHSICGERHRPNVIAATEDGVDTGHAVITVEREGRRSMVEGAQTCHGGS
jgi:hypothetical protein